MDRCTHCYAVREEYAEDEVGHCVIILNTFIAREPALAAPLLPEILLTVARVARQPQVSTGFNTSLEMVYEAMANPA